MSEAPRPRVVIYSRISKDQAGDAHGVANQLAACEKHARTRGWNIVRRLSDNDLSASNGVHRPDFDTCMRLVDARQCDIVLCWAVDRFVRRIADLEDVITRFEAAGVKLCSVDGDMDLGTDSGRMVARLLGVIARGEVERKGRRQKLAAAEAAKAGKRWTGCPRPFGYRADHKTPATAEARAVADACTALLGGSTIASVAREWERLGLKRPQAGSGKWSRVSVTTILLNPRIAGLSAHNGKIVLDEDGEPVTGDWTPLVPRETWEAVRDLLGDPARKRSHGTRTLLGGVAKCACGNRVTGSVNHLGHKIYRCDPQTRDGRDGPHVTRAAAVADLFVEDAVTARLSRPDAARMIDAPKRAEVTRLREEAAARRRRLDGLAAAFADGEISRGQLATGTERINSRLQVIDAELTEAGRESVLTPLIAVRNARAAWDALDLASKRSVIGALMTLRLLPAGQGARRFDPDTVDINWLHDLGQ